MKRDRERRRAARVKARAQTVLGLNMRPIPMSDAIHIWTDGACSGNPGHGGWGAVLRAGRHEREISGAEAATTNNRMELMAAIEALNALKKPSAVLLHTDSKYVMDGVTRWIHGWKKNGWKTADKKPVKNEDLWRALDAAASRHQVTWKWVKGHADDEMNNRADELARGAIKTLR